MSHAKRASFLKLERIRHAGVRARLEGKPYLTCPFPIGTVLWRIWSQGWTDEDFALHTGGTE